MNKWDICRQNPYFVGGQGSAGFSAPIMRVADAILMLAEVKAELGANAEAINLVNQFGKGLLVIPTIILQVYPEMR